MKARLNAFIAGIKAGSPLMVGAVPFGMIYGALAVEAGLSPLMAQSMSLLVFAGSAQFIMAQLIEDGTPLLIIFVTACLVNLRHVLYSASIAPYTRALSTPWKWALAYLLTDEAYAIGITGYQSKDHIRLEYTHWFFLGASLSLWAAWQTSTAVGVFLGAQIPASWSLDFALPLTFIALVVPALTERSGIATALAAGAVAILAAYLPYNMGLMVASIIAMIVGLAVESSHPAAPSPHRADAADQPLETCDRSTIE